MARKVYEGVRQFDNKESFTEAINIAWEDYSLNYIKSLYESIPKSNFLGNFAQGI